MGLTKDIGPFTSLSGKTWLEYVYKFENESDFNTLATLKSMFGDLELAKMLHNSFSTDEMAKKLQEAQFITWRTAGMPKVSSAKDVDLLLEIMKTYHGLMNADLRKARSPPQPLSS